ncbi:MAG: histidine kinase [Herbaspirillum sp.]|jgi:sigma-E factor negative regulatory protein RseA|nr:histidine kinase [Herbaspirillum sp.]
MDTKELSKEQISAFADGELSDAQADVVLASLRTEQGLAAWNAYHLIGDAARSDETAVAMSPDFFSKFSARLDAEPTIIAPAHADRQQQARATTGKLMMRRFAIPALALSLAAAIVIILQPQPAAVVATGATGTAVTGVATAATSAPASTQTASSAPAAAGTDAQAVATLLHDGEVVRDPKIDKFLGAHEGFTPQQSSEQLSRSAAFNVEADK